MEPARRSARPATVLGTRIHSLDIEACVHTIARWATAGTSRYVCACNAHSVVTAARDPAMAAALDGADLRIADGAPIAWAMRRTGRAQPRVTGPDLMWSCCARAERDGLPVFLFGCTERTLALLSARLKASFPRLAIAGTHAPAFGAIGERENELALLRMRESGARIVFVALGCPRQEAWMAAHAHRVPAVMLGVGAAFDYHAGVVRRAPPWMRALGLEWLYRLASEPRRLWRRYLVTNTLFIVFLLRQTIEEKRHVRI